MLDVVETRAKIETALAPCRLGAWPTPLIAMDALAAACGLEALWVKREDRSSTHYGGSKVRGLEFLLAGLPRDTVVVTVGGTGSTHCLATAVHARALGLRAVLAAFPQPPSAQARAIAAAAVRTAAVVVAARWRIGLPGAVARAWLAARRRGRPHWVAGGGADPRAVVGHALAGLELMEQCAGPPDAIVVPLGSSGTAAGLVLAVRWLGWPSTVVAVRVAPVIVANAWRVKWLARRATHLLAAHGMRSPLPASRFPLTVIDGMGRGYGYATPAGDAAIALAARHGLTLDPTYTAKAFAVVPSLARRGYRRVVFWHTFAPPPLEGDA
jgi:1-aminocyclopropane-1-carboxylate deaminase/D-cysteine desulfhydrase-like pyridoxal-dependent ACC family enzyme